MIELLLSPGTGIDSFFDLICKNWAVIALIISEMAVLLPAPYNSIVRIFVKFVSIIFQNRVSKHKKLLS